MVVLAEGEKEQVEALQKATDESLRSIDSLTASFDPMNVSKAYLIDFCTTLGREKEKFASLEKQTQFLLGRLRDKARTSSEELERVYGLSDRVDESRDSYRYYGIAVSMADEACKEVDRHLRAVEYVSVQLEVVKAKIARTTELA